MTEPYNAATIDDAWADVRAHRPLTHELTVYEIDLEVPGGRVLLGVGDDGYRRILFPLGPGGPCKEDTRSAGVRIKRSELLDGAVRTPFIEVTCKRPALNDLFSSMASEILNLVAEDPSRPDLKAGAVLGRWRTLLKAQNESGLELNAVIGLMGELIIMEQIVRGGTTDCEIWTGPDMSRHDFTLSGGSVEVKTTTATAGWRVEIHGVRQLELPPSGNLILAAVRLERSPQGDRHLSDQIARLIDIGVDGESLWQKLNLLDVYEEPGDRLSEHRFNFRESVGFRVGTAFPRIASETLTDGSLPEEVVDLIYTLDLTGTPHLDIEDLIMPILAGQGAH